MIHRRYILISLFFLSLASGGNCQGPKPGADDQEKSASPLVIRRVLIPEDRLDEFISGYFAMKRIDFENHIGKLRSLGPSSGAQIERARYSARLERAQLVNGEARIDISNHGEGISLLSFDECRLAIGEASWLDPQPREAVIALDAEGKLIVPVKRSSTLFFPWSLRGKQSAFGAIVFDLSLPACPMNQITLDLPLGLAPEVDQGVVILLGKVDLLDVAYRRWIIELGGHTHATLRIVSDLESRKANQFVLVRENSTYTLDPHTLNMSCELQCDVYNEPLRQMVLDLDPTLHLISAYLGNIPLSLRAVANIRQDRKSVSLVFPEPIQGAGHLIRLSALAPPVFDEKWRLPSLQARNVHWQEGGARIIVPKPLMIRQILTEGCRQTDFSLLHAPSSGETIELQSFSPISTIDLVVSREESRVAVTAGTTIRFGAGGMTSLLIADVTALTGDRFLLEADIPRRWIIDSVEMQPDNMLDDWRVLPRGPRSQRLELRLSKSLGNTDKARIFVGAHRPLPPANVQISFAQFRLAKFLNVAPLRHLFSVRADLPYQMTLTGDADLVRLDPSQLSATEAQLVDTVTGTTLFVDERAAERLKFRLRSQPARYSTEIDIDLEIHRNRLKQLYHIHCKPESSSVNSLFVHFSQVSAEPVEWKVVGESDRAITARRLTDSEQQRVKVTGGETWEITLRRPRGVSFEITAHRTVDMGMKQFIPLVTVLEAVSQTGILSIEADEAIHVDHDGALRSVPVEPQPNDQFTTTLAAYRYDPLQLPQVIVSRLPAADQQPLAWVWRQHIESHISDDKVLHSAVFKVENTGLDQFALKIPANTIIRQLKVAGKAISLTSFSSSPNELLVPLPTGSRFATIQLSCESPCDAFWLYSNVEPIVPILDIPVLQRSWNIWLPPGYEAVSPHDNFSSLEPVQIPWTQRLFGSIGKGKSYLLNPFLLSSNAPTNDNQGPSSAEQYIEYLGNRQTWLRNNTNADEITWQSLLDVGNRGDRASSIPQVLIDTAGLSAAGVTSQSIITKAQGETDLQLGVSLLEQSNLVLLQAPNSLILTDSTCLADYTGIPHKLRYHVVEQIKPEWLSDGRLISTGSWLTTEHLPQTPWEPLPRWGIDGVATRGWTAYHIDGYQEESPRLRIFLPSTLAMISWAVLLMTAAGCWWLTARWPIGFLLALAGAGCVALLVPVALVSVISGLFQGVLLGGVLSLTRSRLQSPNTVAKLALDSTVRLTSLPQWIVFVVTSSLLFSMSARSDAQQDDHPVAKNKPVNHVYKVYIPVDEKNQPAGSYVHLPMQLYNRLQQRTVGTAPQRWLLHTASYQLKVEQGSPSAPLPVGELQVRYELEVLQPNSHVSVPLHREGLFLLDGKAQLNGQSVDINWTTDGQSLILDVPNPDLYTLDISFQVTGFRDGEIASFDLAIPRIARSRLRMNPPSNSSPIEVVNALGAISIDSETGDILAELGPTDRLTLSWEVKSDEEERLSVDVNELLWLKVRPSSVVIDAMFQFSSSNGLLREVRIVADPRLRMLPLRADVPVKQQQIETGMIQTISLRLREPYQTKVNIHATFLLTGASGVGKLVLPRLEAQVVGNRQRLLALSVSPELEFEMDDERQFQTVSGKDFLDAWGGKQQEEMESPDMAFRLPPEESFWALSSKPRRPRTTVHQQLSVSIGLSHTQIDFNAFLSTSEGQLFQHRLTVPASLHVDSISVQQDGVERALRWSRSGDFAITVFLDGPVMGVQQLAMRGSITNPSRGKWILPIISIADTATTTHRIDVYRRQEVRVKLVNSTGFALVPDQPVGQYTENNGRLVAALLSNSEEKVIPVDSTSAIVSIQPNNSVTTGILATKLIRSDGHWTAEVTCFLNIRGVADAFRFDIPQQWSGPFEIEGEVETQQIVIPGQTRSILVVRPTQAVTGKFTVRIRALLETAPSIRVAAPEISLLDVKDSDLDRFLLLPTQVERQKIEWELRGLQKIDSPHGSDTLPLQPSRNYDVFSVLRQGFQARIKDIERASGEPHIWLSDVQIAMNGQCSYFGLATFDLEPAGIQHCIVSLPSDCNLVHATVSDLPAMIQSAPNGRWQITLTSNQLPQRIGIIYTGRLPLDGASWNKGFLPLAAPVLEGIDVRHTLFTIAVPSHMDIVTQPFSEGTTYALDQQMLRFATMVKLLDSASDVTLQSTPMEAEVWYYRWAQRLAIARSILTGLQIDRSDDVTFDLSQLLRLDQQQANAIEKLAMNGVHQRAVEDMSRATGPADLLSVSGDKRAHVIFCSFDGHLSSLNLHHSQGNKSGFFIAGALPLTLFATLLVLLYLLLRLGPLVEWITQCPQAVGVIIGLAWWLWLTPALFSWIIIAISIIASLRTFWKNARHGSRFAAS